MNILGFDIVRRRKAVPQNLQGLNYPSYWWSSFFGPITESFTGAWQKNVTLLPTQTMLSFSPVYACVSGIAADISKMRVKLSRNTDGIWTEVTTNQPWLPLLRRPNRNQDHIQFFRYWMISKLLYGNTYALKQRDQRGVVNALYVLQPMYVRVLIAEDGGVYYELQRDDLMQITDRVVVPASEIIHDRMCELWHPMIGISPLYAAGLSATQGNAIQMNATNTFTNRSMPGGIVKVPGAISNETAARLKESFQTLYGGANAGKVAVLADGMEFQPVAYKSDEQQLIEQLRWTVEDVARAFRYPAWKLGGPQPPYTKPELAQTAYYTDCLQEHVEAIEVCLDQGLELPSGLGTEFDTDTLLRMDKQSLYETIDKAGKFMKIDEQRYMANLPPLELGGDTVYRQQQDHSIEALAKRDESADPFGSQNPAPPATPSAETTPPAATEPMTQQAKDIDLEYLAYLVEAESRKAFA